MTNRGDAVRRRPIGGNSEGGTRPSDRRLLECFVARSGPAAEAAFAELVRRHGPLVLGACRHLLRNSHDVEDAFQSTFLILARKADSLRHPERLTYWLYGVAARVARKTESLNQRWRRRQAREPARLVTVRGRDCAGQEELRTVGREELNALHEELGRLPEKYRLPIVLCDLGGMTHAEAAARLCWPLGSLSVRLMRARDLLRIRLTRRGIVPGVVVLSALLRPEAARSAVPAGLARATVRAVMARGRAGALATGGSPAISAGPAQLAGVLTAMVAAVLAVVACLAPRDARVEVRAGRPQVSPSVAGAGAPPSRAQGDGPRRPGPRASVAGDIPEDFPRADVRPRPAPPAEALAAYNVLAKRTGRDADAQVRLALWCESNGLAPERLKHLTLAVLRDPGHPGARGLLGQVRLRGRWRQVEDVGPLLAGDPDFSATLAAYRSRRVSLEDTADGHERLALWCEQNRLEAEALAHWTAVTRRDPTRAIAWKRLGYRKVSGRWMKPEQALAETAASDAQSGANRFWKPLLEAYRWALRQGEPRRSRAHAKLAQVADPLAVPAIWSTFARGGAQDQSVAVRVLGQIDSPAATRALAFLAVIGDSAEIRRHATESLVHRDPGEFVGFLVDLLVEPVRYEVRPVQGPGEPGAVVVLGEQFNLRRLYAVPPLPESTIQRIIDPTTLPDSNLALVAQVGEDNARVLVQAQLGLILSRNLGLVRRNLALAAEATLSAQRQQVDELERIDAHNRVVHELDRRIEAPLRALTGKDFGHDREAWRRWWADEQGYVYRSLRSKHESRPTVEQVVPLAFSPNYQLPQAFSPSFPNVSMVSVRGTSCFGAGTMVRTREGAQRIELVRAGDVVLTQDTATGALRFAPVVAVFHNEPAPTLRVELEGQAEPIVATGIHRFWKSGTGWVLARNLEPGDAIRTLGGLARVVAISKGGVEPVYNLELGSGQSFFVGNPGALVHDHSVAVDGVRPFDEVPAESSN